MATRLRTLLGDHPGTAALKNGSIKSDLVAFDFADYSPTNKGFKPMVRDAAPDEAWLTWCDQVAIHPATLQRLAAETSAHPRAALVLPTVRRQSPYIHLRRDSTGRIVQILQRREGDAMPEEGESDMGLFALPRGSFVDLLPQYVNDVAVGAATGERNFLPFIAWSNTRQEVVTFPSVDDMEAVGVNTPEELHAVEAYLAARASRSA